MSKTDISIKTAAGDCRSFVFRPAEGQGPWPAVIYYMDAPAIRPVLFEMCQRIADAGYLVLLPDLFYRAGPYEPIVLTEVFGDPAKREHFWKTYVLTTNVEKVVEDTKSFIAYLDTLPDVKPNKIGVTGYCMGGSMAITVAASFPDRVAAAASFHGGRLATDSETSPHKLAPRIKAQVLVAAAEADTGHTPEQHALLIEAFDRAGLTHRTEIWEGARHGWTMRDQPVYNENAAERHLAELSGLLRAALG